MSTLFSPASFSLKNVAHQEICFYWGCCPHQHSGHLVSLHAMLAATPEARGAFQPVLQPKERSWVRSLGDTTRFGAPMSCLTAEQTQRAPSKSGPCPLSCFPPATRACSLRRADCPPPSEGLLGSPGQPGLQPPLPPAGLGGLEAGGLGPCWGALGTSGPAGLC